MVFIYHGITNLMAISGTIGFFGNIGIPLPGFSGYLVAILELVGGMAILIGLWTRGAAALLGIVMLVAIFAVKLPKMGYQAAELDFALLAILLALMMSGAGKWALWDGGCMCHRKKEGKKK
jgi:uncharacterized membrane protein YphA (DoxX/SURF4 family)